MAAQNLHETVLDLGTGMYRTVPAVRLINNGLRAETCQVAEEVPVEISYNGVPHAVVMATPADLSDLAVGFSLTDGTCLSEEIATISESRNPDAIVLNITLVATAFARFLQTRRSRSGRSHTSCGLCGIESLDRLPLVGVTRPTRIDATAIRRALGELVAYQVLNRSTGAAHAAAWCASSGEIVLVREDVGRHNALDKLIGGRISLPLAEQQGFCLVTSRCSFEMVQKATAAAMGLLVCISAPTTLAIDQARRAGLSLVALARADSQTIYVGDPV